MKRIYLLVFALLISIPLLAFWNSRSETATVTSTPSTQYDLQTVFKADDVIWSFAFISEHELLVTLREGKLLYVDLKQNTQKELAVPDIEVKGQGGLLDVHLRTIKGNQYVYLTYSTRVLDNISTALARGQWKNNTLSGLETLFVATVQGDSGRHFGSRLLFKDQHIYMTIGDRAERSAVQNLSYHNGKILRLNLDGTPAAGNPFSKQANALPEIWSYGHRNPQGIDLDPVSGDIYSCEFGPRGGDELNRIKPGNNYGWPVITYGSEYWGPKIGETHHPDMQQPVTHWTPSISPSGMAFYSGDKLPAWKNSLFLANLGSSHLRRLELSRNKVTRQTILFKDLGERFRHVRNGPDGYLYVSTDSGKIIRIATTQ